VKTQSKSRLTPLAKFLDSQSAGSLEHWWRNQEIQKAYRELARSFIKTLRPLENPGKGRGIVICGGGLKYFPSLWITLNQLRRVGCGLPIQVWYMGDSEFDPYMRRILHPLDVEFIDAHKVREKHPVRIMAGWELKPYSVLHSSFKEVMFLDSDSLPLRDPSYLFESPEFKKYGAIFWPDFPSWNEKIDWPAFGLKKPDIPEAHIGDPHMVHHPIEEGRDPPLESGQSFIDKAIAGEELQLTHWWCQHSDYCFGKLMNGDNHACHIAWRLLKSEYALPRFWPGWDGHMILQHDFQGRVLFEHRTTDKWSLVGNHLGDGSAVSEPFGMAMIANLKKVWKGELWRNKHPLPQETELAAVITNCYRRCCGEENRELELMPDGSIGHGATNNEQHWSVWLENGKPTLSLSGANLSAVLQKEEDCWEGNGIKLLPASAVNQSSAVWLVGDIDTKGGYTVLFDQLEKHLRLEGMEVQRGKIGNLPPDGSWSIVINPLCWINRYPIGSRTIPLFTWESDHIEQVWVDSLNRAGLSLTTCQWTADACRRAGVRNIKVLPLGCDPDIYFDDNSFPETVTFGAVSDNLELVMKAFLSAFGDEENVKLKLRPHYESPLIGGFDPSITVDNEWLSDEGMAEWYRSLTALVNVRNAEGFGLQPLEAMACGRPVIAPVFAGLCEFMDHSVGYPVDYTLIPATGRYRGSCSYPKIESLSAKMREVYNDIDGAKSKGRQAAQRAKLYNWSATARKLKAMLEELGWK